MIEIPKKRTSGPEKVRALRKIEDDNTKLKAKAFDAKGLNALTNAEAKRIAKKSKEIDAIINKRKKQIEKTHSMKDWYE